MKQTANQPMINVVPLEAKSHAAGSEKGQQLIPALVGLFVIWEMAQ
ncbi:hypothetical protein [Duganella sp. Root1480D1]|nr:hypothetical protein [Duganella sp. Root1480D1]